jgi:gamma-glutamyl phosphate reductase
MTDFAKTAETIAKRARAASRLMAQCSTAVKSEALNRMAAALVDAAETIQAANAEDVAAANEKVHLHRSDFIGSGLYIAIEKA